MDCSPPGSSVHGISQARILEWVAISYSRGSSWPRDWTHVSWCSWIGRWIFNHWATWEAPDHMVTLLLIIGANPILFTIPAKLFFSSVQPLSCVWLFVTPWTVAHQAPPSMGFPRQEYWNGLPFPSPGDLPDPGIEPRSQTLKAVSCIASRFFVQERGNYKSQVKKQ